jgi:probable rRNA maturation factor
MDFPEIVDQFESGVEFYSEEIDFELQNEEEIAEWIMQTVADEGKKFHHCSFVFCSDEYLHKINLEYLSHDDYTDVITFPYAENPVEGDIYISIERLKDNARSLGIPFLHELHRVIIHGTLHLCGYTDKTPLDKTKMTEKEDFYLSKLPS